ncbi:hypothetical protein AURDEDRAFT_116796 [Auricularia subglabra TFB-10046 SS5]|nr:hypothetical protein AURDEDRAFT_116796 [Auricularia subglabra TFB-10046 SS5]
MPTRVLSSSRPPARRCSPPAARASSFRGIGIVRPAAPPLCASVFWQGALAGTLRNADAPCAPVLLLFAHTFLRYNPGRAPVL